jgi:hypothetical protein
MEPESRLHSEIAYLAYHLHWPLDELLDLEHPLRRTYVAEVATLNRRAAGED